jgi:hypothetical protein
MSGTPFADKEEETEISNFFGGDMEETTVAIRKRKKSGGLSNSPLLNYSLKFALGVVVVLVFLTITQCTINKPEAPTWDSHLALPVVNRTYLIPEIINKIDQPGLSLDDSGEVMYSFETVLDTIRVSDNLSTSDLTQSLSQTVGQVTLDPQNTPPMTAYLDDYVSIALNDVPDASFDITEDSMPLGNFNWAEVAEGNLNIILENNFGVNLDTVIVQVYDIDNARILAVDSIPSPGLSDGAIDTLQVALTGQTISNLFRLDIHCHTEGGTVLALAEKSLMANIGCGEGIVVTAAEGNIPQITKDFSQAVPLSDNNTIMSADLSGGNIALQITNSTNLTSNIQISIPDFDLDGTPLTISRTLGPNSANEVNVDLTGYTFGPSDLTAPQEIAIEVSAIIDSTSPEMVVVDEADSIRVDASITGLAFSSMTGIIDSSQAAFDAISVDVELPMGFDSLRLVNADLVLEIESGINLPGALDINISGNGGQLINLAGNIEPGSYNNPLTSYIFASDVSSFLNPIPSSITIDGTALFGDGSTVGTITANDFIVSRVRITSPLEVVIGQSNFEGDISSEEIEQDDIDKITDHLIRAQFVSTIINHLPLGVTVEVYLSGDSATLYSAPQLVIGPIEVDAGLVGVGNVVATATESENIIVLDSTDIKILENPILYTGNIITIHSSNGQTVKVSGADYITTRGVVEVDYRIDDNF